MSPRRTLRGPSVDGAGYDAWLTRDLDDGDDDSEHSLYCDCDACLHGPRCIREARADALADEGDDVGSDV